MPADEAREVLREELPLLLDFLKEVVPALAVRPVLGSVLTAAVDLGVRTFFEYWESVRAHPIVPFAMGHRPTRRELAAFVRRREELAHLRDDLERAQEAKGDEARQRWADLRARVGEAQAELAAPLAGHRDAVEKLDGFLARLIQAGTVDLPASEKRAVLRYVRERLEADERGVVPGEDRVKDRPGGVRPTDGPR